MPCTEPWHPTELLDVGNAGASALAEGQRRREQRIAKRRSQFGVLGAGLAALNDPQHEQSWREGARGERKTAERLVKGLAKTGVVLLHDRRTPGSRANIDHLAIGPGGVTVIDSRRSRAASALRSAAACSPPAPNT